MKYLSKEWEKEALKKLKEELPPEKMNGVTASMSDIFQNCPDDKEKYLYLNMVNGEFVNFEVGEGEPPKAQFLIIGDYDVYVQIANAKLGSQLALMRGKLKLKGNMVKALKLAKISDRINKVFSKIPCEY